MIWPAVVFLVGLQPAALATPVRVGPVEVYTSIVQDMFPDSWRGGDIAAKALPLAPREVDRSLRVVKLALRKYPTKVLAKNLKRIYLVRELLFFDLPYGGTNSSDALYLCNAGVKAGFTNSYLENSVYHEFSSILLRNYPALWSEASWKAANPPGFRYLGDGVQAIRQGATSLLRDPSLYPSGFLTTYSKASVEEDFNVVSESMFSGDRSFWKAVDSHERLRKKASLAIKLYGGIDPRFSEKWFRSLSLARPTSRG
jgi:hypothetical protein